MSYAARLAKLEERAYAGDVYIIVEEIRDSDGELVGAKLAGEKLRRDPHESEPTFLVRVGNACGRSPPVWMSAVDMCL